MKNTHVSTLLTVAAAGLVGAALMVGASYLGFLPGKVAVQPSPSPTTESLSEVQLITEKLVGIVELPRGETPSLATVTDPQKLQDQSFFKQAEVGDKVLLYPTAGRAVLYRPKTGKVVETGPFILTSPNGGTATPSTNPLTTATPPTGSGQ